MGQFIDLRKYNIKNEQDVMEFLELFVSKAPQIVAVMKKSKLAQQSLKNRLEVANTQASQVVDAGVVDADASVLQRMQGGKPQPAQKPGESHLARMKAAAAPTQPPAPKPEERTVDPNELPPAPVQPGEIGQLAVPNQPTHAPQPANGRIVDGVRIFSDGDTFFAVDAENFVNLHESNYGFGETEEAALDAYRLILADDEDRADVAMIRERAGEPTETYEEFQQGLEATDTAQSLNGEEVAQAAGSKSERTADNDLQPEDTEESELTDEELAALQPAPPTTADTTPVNETIAQKSTPKTRRKNNSRKKK